MKVLINLILELKKVVRLKLDESITKLDFRIKKSIQKLDLSIQ